MRRHVLGRLLLAGPQVLLAAFLTFSMVHAIPGDAVDYLVGERVEPSRKDELRRAYHLDLPLVWPADLGGGGGGFLHGTQFGRFLVDLTEGQLRSMHTGRPVGQILTERLPMTALLAAAALLVSVGVGIPLGALAGARPGSWTDRAAAALALLGMSAPTFWLGPMLIWLFSVKLGWLPVLGSGCASHLILPACTLGLGAAALQSRQVRAAVREGLAADPARVARAKGIHEGWVVFRHVLRVSAAPLVTLTGIQAGALLAGSVITEEIFVWPGLGRELVGAIRARDLPVIQGCVLVIAGSYLTVNLAADLVAARLDPRIELAR
jgi:ABC-type dipeptide/oligopeptide/nickel transport system permease component